MKAKQHLSCSLCHYELDTWEESCVPSQNSFPAYKHLCFGTSSSRHDSFVFNGRRVHHIIEVFPSVKSLVSIMLHGKAFCSSSVFMDFFWTCYLMVLFDATWYLQTGMAKVSYAVLTFAVPLPVTFLGTLESTQMLVCSWLGDGGYWCCHQNLKWAQRDNSVWVCVEYGLVCFSVPFCAFHCQGPELEQE